MNCSLSKYLYACAVWLMFVGISSVSAGEPAPRQKLVISTVENSPDTYIAEAVLREAYKRLGIDIEILRLPATESLQKSNSGKVDGEAARIDGISKKFTHLIQIPIPVSLIQGSVYSINNDLNIRWWNSLEPYRVGIVRGILFAEEGTAKMQVAKADTYSELVGFLEQGTVDFIIAPKFNLSVWLKNEHKDLSLRHNGTLETLLLYHYLHDKHADLVPEVSAVLKEMIIEGAITRIGADVRTLWLLEATQDD